MFPIFFYNKLEISKIYFRFRVAREQSRLQGGRLQARDLGRGRRNLESALSGFVSGQEGLRLDILNNSGSSDQAGENIWLGWCGEKI